MVGKVKFEARIKELVENIPDLAVLVEPLLIVRRVLREQFVIQHRRLPIQQYLPKADIPANSYRRSSARCTTSLSSSGSNGHRQARFRESAEQPGRNCGAGEEARCLRFYLQARSVLLICATAENAQTALDDDLLVASTIRIRALIKPGSV
jgi:hypothetical protein